MKKQKQKVVKLHPKNDMILATCMNCHQTGWYILLDKAGAEATKIIGLRCANRECGMIIKTDIQVKIDKGGMQ